MRIFVRPCLLTSLLMIFASFPAQASKWSGAFSDDSTPWPGVADIAIHEALRYRDTLRPYPERVSPSKVEKFDPKSYMNYPTGAGPYSMATEPLIYAVRLIGGQSKGRWIPTAKRSSSDAGGYTLTEKAQRSWLFSLVIPGNPDWDEDEMTADIMCVQKHGIDYANYLLLTCVPVGEDGSVAVTGRTYAGDAPRNVARWTELPELMPTENPRAWVGGYTVQPTRLRHLPDARITYVR